MQELMHLRDPEKPYRRVFQCEDGTIVKVHAVPVQAGFGRVQWKFTGSHCDAEGHALPYADGLAIHDQAHELVITSDQAGTPEEREARIAEEFNAALILCVRRVQSAVLNESAAQAVYLGALQAPQS